MDETLYGVYPSRIMQTKLAKSETRHRVVLVNNSLLVVFTLPTNDNAMCNKTIMGLQLQFTYFQHVLEVSEVLELCNSEIDFDSGSSRIRVRRNTFSTIHFITLQLPCTNFFYGNIFCHIVCHHIVIIYYKSIYNHYSVRRNIIVIYVHSNFLRYEQMRTKNNSVYYDIYCSLTTENLQLQALYAKLKCDLRSS